MAMVSPSWWSMCNLSKRLVDAQSEAVCRIELAEGSFLLRMAGLVAALCLQAVPDRTTSPVLPVTLYDATRTGVGFP